MAFCVLFGQVARGAPAFAEGCELALLRQMFARASTKMLQDGVVKPEQLARAMNSEVPLNPIEERPTTLTLSASQLYRTYVAMPETRAAWPEIRAELAVVLHVFTGQAAVRQEAAQATEEITSPRMVDVPNMRESEVNTWLLLRNHILLYATNRPLFGLEVREFFTGRRLHRVEASETRGFQTIEENADGDVQAVFFMDEPRPLSIFESLRFRGKTRYVRRILNLRTQRVVEDEFFLPTLQAKYTFVRGGTGPDVVNFKAEPFVVLDKVNATVLSRKRYWLEQRLDGHGGLILREHPRYSHRERTWVRTANSNGEYVGINSRAYDPGHTTDKIELKRLRDGSIAALSCGCNFVGNDAHYDLRFLPPALNGGAKPVILETFDGPQNLYDSEIYETADGRVLVAALSWGGSGAWLKVYEPARGSKPIVEAHQVSALSGWTKFDYALRFFEARGEVYLAVGRDNRSIEIYEPLRSSAKIASIVGPKGGSIGSFDLWKGAGDQVYFRFEEGLARDTAEMRAATLFNFSRDSGP